MENFRDNTVISERIPAEVCSLVSPLCILVPLQYKHSKCRHAILRARHGTQRERCFVVHTDRYVLSHALKIQSTLYGANISNSGKMLTLVFRCFVRGPRVYVQ